MATCCLDALTGTSRRFDSVSIFGACGSTAGLTLDRVIAIQSELEEFLLQKADERVSSDGAFPWLAGIVTEGAP